MRPVICCFSGYRPEKMPNNMIEGSADFLEMKKQLRSAVIRSANNGYRHFLSGMSRGFDLWAAETVLQLQQEGFPIDLWAAVAYPGMQDYWERQWQTRYHAVLQNAGRIFVVCPQYTPECFAIRDRFLVDNSSRCICYYDGIAGGTEYTVKYAVRSKLSIENLADRQLCFADFSLF